MTTPGEHRPAPHSRHEYKFTVTGQRQHMQIRPAPPVKPTAPPTGWGATFAICLVFADVLWLGFTSALPIYVRVGVGVLWLLFALMVVVFDQERQARSWDPHGRPPGHKGDGE